VSIVDGMTVTAVGRRELSNELYADDKQRGMQRLHSHLCTCDLQSLTAMRTCWAPVLLTVDRTKRRLNEVAVHLVEYHAHNHRWLVIDVRHV
jgi:hypothetical protein